MLEKFIVEISHECQWNDVGEDTKYPIRCVELDLNIIFFEVLVKLENVKLDEFLNHVAMFVQPR